MHENLSVMYSDSYKTLYRRHFCQGNDYLFWRDFSDRTLEVIED
jgi:hypothetical protein